MTNHGIRKGRWSTVQGVGKNNIALIRRKGVTELDQTPGGEAALGGKIKSVGSGGKMRGVERGPAKLFRVLKTSD